MNTNNIPLFPFKLDCNPHDHTNENIAFSAGATLRDFYAAFALAGYLANGSTADNAVAWSYRAADKMLERREQKV